MVKGLNGEALQVHSEMVSEEPILQVLWPQQPVQPMYG